MVGTGFVNRFLNSDEVETIVVSGLDALHLNGKRVLIIIPDGTRTMPMPLMFRYFQKYLVGKVSALDFLVALGTHQAMNDDQLSNLVGQPVINGMVKASRIYNHDWEDASCFKNIGIIPALEIEQISGGLLSLDVPVTLNKLIFEYDQIIICGPVFPHEVVGFSGGNKYFFPGIAGSDIINFTHWLGALMTSQKIIGTGDTPVRTVINRAAELIDRPAACFALVVTHGGIAGIYVGTPREAWKAAAELSARRHIIKVDNPYQQVISVMPKMYDDLWTAAKGMYKLEPVVADEGEVIIYAPHLNEVSYTHGKILDEVGYHCRDYFLAQWEKYKGYPWGVLAHSTHVKGMGVYDKKTSSEKPRIRVTLATGIPEHRCRKINLGYKNPKSIDIEKYLNREKEGILVVPQAGEMLYRLR